MKLQDIETAFTNGCDTIVSGITAYGITPKSNSPADIVSAIGSVYNSGVANGGGDGVVLNDSCAIRSKTATLAFSHTLEKSGNYVIAIVGTSDDAVANYRARVDLNSTTVLSEGNYRGLTLGVASFTAKSGDVLKIYSHNTYYQYTNTTRYLLIHVGE